VPDVHGENKFNRILAINPQKSDNLEDQKEDGNIELRRKVN
jgi:hypothetical protein